MTAKDLECSPFLIPPPITKTPKRTFKTIAELPLHVHIDLHLLLAFSVWGIP